MSTTGESVVIWGEVLWDRFPDGARLGGAPANVAWHLGQAGGWPILISRVGDDEAGRDAVDQLSLHVDTTLVQTDPERATGEVAVELVGAEARYTLRPDRAWERIAYGEREQSAIAEAGALVYGTLAQRTPEGFAAWRAAIAACPPGVLRVCDVNLRPMSQPAEPIAAALAAADLVKINDRELAQLTAFYGWPDPVAHLLDADHPRTVVVTHGAAGSTIYGQAGHGGGGRVAIPGTRAAPGGDNVGCGDAYLAILVHGMLCGWDLALSGRAASRYAAAVAEVRGATPSFDEDRLADLLEDG